MSGLARRLDVLETEASAAIPELDMVRDGAAATQALCVPSGGSVDQTAHEPLSTFIARARRTAVEDAATLLLFINCKSDRSEDFTYAPDAQLEAIAACGAKEAA